MGCVEDTSSAAPPPPVQLPCRCRPSSVRRAVQAVALRAAGPASGSTFRLMMQGLGPHPTRVPQLAHAQRRVFGCGVVALQPANLERQPVDVFVKTLKVKGTLPYLGSRRIRTWIQELIHNPTILLHPLWQLQLATTVSLLCIALFLCSSTFACHIAPDEPLMPLQSHRQHLA